MTTMTKPAEGQDAPRCRGTTAEGEPCRARPEWINEDGWCRMHDPDPEVVKERERLSRLGGAVTAAKASRGLDPDALGPLETPADAQRWAAEVARAVASGRLSSAQAQATARLLSEWHRAYEASGIHRRLEELAARLERS